MLPETLKRRKAKLEKALRTLSGTAFEIIKITERSIEDSVLAVEFDRSTRIKPANLRLHIWEQFRDVDADPLLYAFAYCVTNENDVQKQDPIFRYECHPDVGENNGDDGDGEPVFQNPYATVPHFHPDQTDLDNVRKLHFPFHREERKSVVFALISWIQVDLVTRFY